MLIDDCKGCSYLHWAVGIGLGIRCMHPQHRTPEQPPIPLISEIQDCELYKPKEKQKTMK